MDGYSTPDWAMNPHINPHKNEYSLSDGQLMEMHFHAHASPYQHTLPIASAGAPPMPLILHQQGSNAGGSLPEASLGGGLQPGWAAQGFAAPTVETTSVAQPYPRPYCSETTNLTPIDQLSHRQTSLTHFEPTGFAEPLVPSESTSASLVHPNQSPFIPATNSEQPIISTQTAKVPNGVSQTLTGGHDSTSICTFQLDQPYATSTGEQFNVEAIAFIGDTNNVILIVLDEGRCPICSIKCLNFLRVHIRDSHGSDINGIALLMVVQNAFNLCLPRYLRIQITQASDGNVICPSCDRRYPNYMHLGAHIINHNLLKYGLKWYKDFNKAQRRVLVCKILEQKGAWGLERYDKVIQQPLTDPVIKEAFDKAMKRERKQIKRKQQVEEQGRIFGENKDWSERQQKKFEEWNLYQQQLQDDKEGMIKKWEEFNQWSNKKQQEWEAWDQFAKEQRQHWVEWDQYTKQQIRNREAWEQLSQEKEAQREEWYKFLRETEGKWGSWFNTIQKLEQDGEKANIEWKEWQELARKEQCRYDSWKQWCKQEYGDK